MVALGGVTGQHVGRLRRVYQRFGEERALPFHHLVAAIVDLDPLLIVDLGCGISGDLERVEANAGLGTEQDDPSAGHRSRKRAIVAGSGMIS